jgi:hypothetical protein
MEQPSTSSDRRSHPRAPLQLSARIRWQGPLGMRLEVAETVDVSRDGVLLHRKEPCEARSRVWIVLPFVLGDLGSVQPETPGRIARVARAEDGSYWVAVRLEHPERGVRSPGERERRRVERIPLSLPIFLRPSGTPWPEESMTYDLSAKGVRFETAHLYVLGQTVIAQVPWGEWAKRGQIHGRVVRVEDLRDSPSIAPTSPNDGTSNIITSIAVEWLNPNDAELPAKP